MRLGEGTCAGRLIDLGDYPGLLASGTAGQIIHGEIIRLRDPAATFAWLDAYEDIDPADPSAGPYRRGLRPVRLDRARTVLCWLYLLRQAPRGAAPVRNGDWLSHCRIRKARASALADRLYRGTSVEDAGGPKNIAANSAGAGVVAR